MQMKKLAVMFGAGNVGRGFLGQLFSESGYEVVFVDVDQLLIDTINARGRYRIRLVDNETSDEVLISPVRALNSKDIEAVSEAVARADIAATAVGARILPFIAPLVAAGVKKRALKNQSQPLNIIICENLKNAAAVFRQMVSDSTKPEEQDYFKANVGFVDTVIGRMVPPPTPEMRSEDPSLIQVEPYKELPVDRNGFIGDIPAIVGMEPCDNFPAYTARKLYIHNCGHAILAYLGYLKGLDFGFEALVDVNILPIFNQALAESKVGIVAEYGVKVDWLEKHIKDLTYRFANRSLGDTIFRLGRDPLRKLSPSDRLIGAARLAEKAGKKPEALCLGIAAGYHFSAADDPMALALQERITKEGIERVMNDVSGLIPGEPLTELVKEKYLRIGSGSWL
jgi:mannitol-1-phosphate 5-dehydrogenase